MKEGLFIFFLTLVELCLKLYHWAQCLLTFFYNRETLDEIRTILFFSYFAKNFFLNLEYMLTLLIALSASFEMTL